MAPSYCSTLSRRLIRLINVKEIVKKAEKKIFYEKKKVEFFNDLKSFEKNREPGTRPAFEIKKLIPFFSDNTSTTSFDPHYTYHPAWAARVLNSIKPIVHVDISSTLNFSAIASAFVPIEFYDYRPAALKLSNLATGRADLLSLDFSDDSIESLSCMHTVEHIGLGRYGDKVDYNGDLKAIKELQRVVAPKGNLLFVVPIGKRRIEFNAHRIYNVEDILDAFDELKLVEFSLIPDDFEDSGIITDASYEFANMQDWGCGCFWFTK